MASGSGKVGPLGHIEDGTIQGQITTWDVAKTEWTPDSRAKFNGNGQFEVNGDIRTANGAGATVRIFDASAENHRLEISNNSTHACLKPPDLLVS